MMEISNRAGCSSANLYSPIAERANIYETIGDQTTTSIDPTSPSKSHQINDDEDDTKMVLFNRRQDTDDEDGDEQSAERQNLLSGGDQIDRVESPACCPVNSFGRRYQNANDDNSRQLNEDDEIRTLNDDDKEVTTASIDQQQPHYQVPNNAKNTKDSGSVQQLPTAALVSEEMNQLMETKRMRTLEMLRSKEAPKASFELTSPVIERYDDLAGLALITNHAQDQSNYSLTKEQGTRDILGSPDSHQTNASYYENAGNHDSTNEKQQQQEQSADREPSGESLMSPSESQNFNTLSLVSDVLGDLSHEENSLVQQVGPN